jgi:hypothetical protein
MKELFNQQSLWTASNLFPVCVCVGNHSKYLTHTLRLHTSTYIIHTHTQTFRVCDSQLALDTNEQKKTDFPSSSCVCVCMWPKWLHGLDWTREMIRTTLVSDEYTVCVCGGLGRRRSVDSWRWRHLAIAFGNSVFIIISFFTKGEKYRWRKKRNEEK